jgi:hypothetical protein
MLFQLSNKKFALFLSNKENSEKAWGLDYFMLSLHRQNEQQQYGYYHEPAL